MQDYIILFFSLIILETVHLVQRKYGSVGIVLATKPVYFRWILYYAILVMIIFFGQSTGQFIYVQF